MSAPLAVTRILVAVDFDETSAAAVAVAGELAGAFGAGLVAVHAAAIDRPSYFMPSQVEALESERSEALARVSAELVEWAARHTRMPVETLTEEGPAAEVILRHSAAFDLLVIGTHRWRGMRRWWLGSVAEAIVRRAFVPVLVVPAGHRAAEVLRLATVVAPRAASDLAERWVGALEQRLRMTVVRTEAATACPADTLRAAGLIVVPIPPAGPQLDSMAELLQECVLPVLFVPSAAFLERSSR